MQRAVKIPRRACRFRRSREALVPRPMKIATSPIGSIATKTGIKARKNFSIIRHGRRFHFTEEVFYTMFAPFINQTFPNEKLAVVHFALCRCGRSVGR